MRLGTVQDDVHVVPDVCTARYFGTSADVREWTFLPTVGRLIRLDKTITIMPGTPGNGPWSAKAIPQPGWHSAQGRVTTTSYQHPAGVPTTSGTHNEVVINVPHVSG